LLETDMSALVVLSPSAIVPLFDLLERYADLLIEDVKRGGLSAAMTVEPPVRQYVVARYQGNPARAEQLKAALDSKQVGAQLWPGLQLAICWRSPAVRPDLDLLEPSLGALPQRDYATTSAEGIIAIPYEDGVSGGALAVDTHFYEFIPGAFADRDDPPTLLAHEVELGKTMA
jgi:hypothetical protein